MNAPSDRRTRDAVNAPSGVKEGVVRGGEKLMTGIFGGIAGIVTKPVTGMHPFMNFIFRSSSR